MKFLAVYSGYVRQQGKSGQLYAIRRCEWQPSEQVLIDLGVNSVEEILSYKAGYFMLANVMGLDIRVTPQNTSQENLVLCYLVEDFGIEMPEQDVFISDGELRNWFQSLLPAKSPQGFLDYLKTNYVTSVFRYRIAALLLEGHVAVDIDFEQATAHVCHIDFDHTGPLPLTDFMVIDQMVKSFCGNSAQRMEDLSALPAESLQKFTHKLVSIV